MSRLSEIAEQLKEEAPATRKMLERIPDDKLAWKPHEKSMTMGQLAGLCADMFGWFSFMIGERPRRPEIAGAAFVAAGAVLMALPS